MWFADWVGNPERALQGWLSLLQGTWGLSWDRLRGGITQSEGGWTVAARGCALRWHGHPHGHAHLTPGQGWLEAQAWQAWEVVFAVCLLYLSLATWPHSSCELLVEAATIWARLTGRGVEELGAMFKTAGQWKTVQESGWEVRRQPWRSLVRSLLAFTPSFLTWAPNTAL